jgi:hypothetical protein
MKTKIVSLVAQSCTLPYRRIAFGVASDNPSDSRARGGLRIVNPRYGRLKICATFRGALLLAASILTGSTSAAADAPTGPAILIYTTVGYPPPPPPGVTNIPGPRLVVALWSDGKIIWSEQRVAGGPPYSAGQYDRKKLEALFSTLKFQGFWTNAALQHPWFGPDSKTTRIVVNDGQHRSVMESWHELFEESLNLVATAQSVRSLEGRNRDEVLREQPQDYRQFRNTWLEIRDKVAELIPTRGDPYTETLPAMQ